jgi:hypothetical protein
MPAEQIESPQSVRQPDLPKLAKTVLLGSLTFIRIHKIKPGDRLRRLKIKLVNVLQRAILEL